MQVELIQMQMNAVECMHADVEHRILLAQFIQSQMWVFHIEDASTMNQGEEALNLRGEYTDWKRTSIPVTFTWLQNEWNDLAVHWWASWGSFPYKLGYL